MEKGKMWKSNLWVIGVVVASSALAQVQASLEIELDVKLEVSQVDDNGRQSVELQPVAKTKSGDVLVYTLRYRNVGGAPATGAMLKDPIPNGTVLVRDSVGGEGTEVSFSLDGKKFSEWPKVKRQAKDGGVEWFDAPAAAVRHIRWKLGRAVLPGESGLTRFKVVVQ